MTVCYHYQVILVHYRLIGAHLARRLAVTAYLASVLFLRLPGRRAFGVSTGGGRAFGASTESPFGY